MSSPLTSLSAWSEDEEDKQSTPPVKLFDIDQLRAAMVRLCRSGSRVILIELPVIMRVAFHRATRVKDGPLNELSHHDGHHSRTFAQR